MVRILTSSSHIWVCSWSNSSSSLHSKVTTPKTEQIYIMISIPRSTSMQSSWTMGRNLLSQKLKPCRMDPAQVLVVAQPRTIQAPAEAATEAEFSVWMDQLYLRRIAMEVDLSTLKMERINSPSLMAMRITLIAMEISW